MENTYIINVGEFEANEKVYPNRCLSASFGGSGVTSDFIPWAEQGNPWDWEYTDGEFVYAPIELPVAGEPQTHSIEELYEAIELLLNGGTE